MIHELGSSIGNRLDLYHDEKFLKVLNNGLEDITWDDIITDEDTFAHPVDLLNIANGKFVTDYQRRVYEEDYEGNGRIVLETTLHLMQKQCWTTFRKGIGFIIFIQKY